jgi:hypothetical protein
MNGEPRGGGQRIQEIATRFREKGATSPAIAMTIHEPEPPPRFETAMKRRLGATGIFVEVPGRYYLDEARLQELLRGRAQFAVPEEDGGRGET